MKLKYYLRGLGIGVFVSVIVMTVAFGNRKPMTDEEIKARAKELGMIENSVLADMNKEDVQDTEDIKEPENTQDTEDIKEPENTQDTEDIKEPENTQDTEDTKEPEDTQDTEDEEDQKPQTPENPNEGTITITVVGGDNSWTVSKRMEEAGLIESAKDFDTHLCRYGYDKKISVGSYKIPVTATHEEMAKILTKMD
ncbi:MAG: hypothetical protein IKJ16_01955 [Agathobacter sp.]|nr:hypothetical protein [Agathobacter sp.]